MVHFRKSYFSGYTLIELIVVIVVIGILASVAMRSMGRVNSVSRLEKTRTRMDRIVTAIIGGTASGQSGEYGYVGDNGCLPSTLDELLHDSHGYPTWDGPYLTDRFSDGNTDSHFRKDAWGSDFIYAGLNLASTGSGTTVTRSIAGSYHALLYNRASFVIFDLNYTPPGPIYEDSVRFSLTFPRNGIMQTAVLSPDAGGFVTFDSIPIGIHTLYLTYLPTGDTITCRIDIAPSSDYYAELQYPADIWGGAQTNSDTLLQADFNSGNDGFSYGDDLFRGTSHPAYASGVRISSGGFSGGALRVTVGGIDNATVHGMSGGWSRDFTVPSNTDAALSFRYNLTQSAEYEHSEYSQVLVSVDGVLYGTFPNDYVDRVIGNGHGGGDISTGWQLFRIDLGTLGAGTHSIAIGAYNNKKTRMNESTVLLIDDVLIIPGSWSL